MREMKIRGYSKEKLVIDSQWVSGYGVFKIDYIDGTSQVILDTISGSYDVFEESVGQYTGLKDKNGKEIYEGDVLKDKNGTGEVKWVQEHSAFLVYVSEPTGYHYLESDGQLIKSEVIGNIYEK